ncbi:MAG: YciI family protein [Devosia sp.]
MRFVCLFHVDAELIGQLSPAELERFDLENREADAALIKSGHYVSALALAGAGEAVTVRRRAGQASATDGPYAETKEQLGGILIIEARDMAEAVEIAKLGPMADYGTVEVRPELNVGWQREQQGR